MYVITMISNNFFTTKNSSAVLQLLLKKKQHFAKSKSFSVFSDVKTVAKNRAFS